MPLPPPLQNTIITIDGPAASGKSSAARGVAKKLGAVFVSSGAYYRALAWSAAQERLDFSDEKKITTWLGSLNLESQVTQGEVHLFLNNVDLTPHLSQPAVTALVSPLAALPAVRAFLLDQLRALANGHCIVMEGRDIGSVVFPEARFKFYLDASLQERIRRRQQQGTIDSIAQRDKQDSSRALAPLLIPQGAVVIDNTHLSVEEVVERIVDHLLFTGIEGMKKKSK
ncbi:MAG: (d)CMP kinase [Chthoniobacterales bacterium]|nr:(d)CMP kinase [Chthoniobacterales bacterium]